MDESKIVRLSNEQFEMICVAVMDYRFIGFFGRLTASDNREFPEMSREQKREFTAELIRVLTMMTLRMANTFRATNRR